MESNQSRIMGHSKTPEVGVGVKINEIKSVAREAGSWWKNLTFFKKGRYRWKDTKAVD